MSYQRTAGYPIAPKLFVLPKGVEAWTTCKPGPRRSEGWVPLDFMLLLSQPRHLLIKDVRRQVLTELTSVGSSSSN